MGAKRFSSMEIDAIGEIMNISLGASATAVSTLLNTRVDITTPTVSVVNRDEFEMQKVEPAIGVEISYVEGLDGCNVILLKKSDVKVIVEMLLGIDSNETSEEDFVLDEINMSAILEVMNQMMGSSATALSEFLGTTVNISTPVSFNVASKEAFTDMYFQEDEQKVVIAINLTIADKLQSEFFHVMSVDLAKKLTAGFFPEEPEEDDEPVMEQPIITPEPVVEETSSSSGLLSQEEIEKMLQANNAPDPVVAEPVVEPTPVAPTPVAPTPVAPAPQPAPVQTMQAPTSDAFTMEMMQFQRDMMRQMQQMQDNMNRVQDAIKRVEETPAPKTISVQPTIQNKIDGVIESGVLQEENMELIRGVPLNVSVEIGRTQKLVKDILELTKGSLVVLDKLAGEQVDLFVNGQCIAHGDVVVVEDNFGIRITEINKVSLLR